VVAGLDDAAVRAPGRGERPRRRTGAAVALVALAAAVTGSACTLRLWPGMGSRMVSGNLPDAVHYSWWLAHTPFALGHGTSPLETTAMNWPTGVSAMNNTTLMLPAVLLWPLTAATSSLLTLNLLNVLSVPLCVLAGYWALRRPHLGLGLGRPAALAGAVAFGISPAIVNSLVGHVTMSFAPLLPVLVALSVRAWTDARPVRAGLVLGAVATAQVFIGEEVLFQAGFGALVVLLVVALSRPRQVRAGAARLVRSLGVAVAVLLVVAGYPLHSQFLGRLRQHGNPFLPDYYGADVTSFVTAGDRLLLHTDAGTAATARFAGGVEEHLAYLGWPLLLTGLAVGVLGWRRSVAVRAAAVGLVLCTVLSLGGRIWVRGEWTEHRGPYALLQSLPVTEASLATRFGLLAALFSGVLLAAGVHALLASGPSRSRFSPRVRAGLGAVLALACLLPLVPRVLPVDDAPAAPSWFRTEGRAQPAGSVLLVLPYPTPVTPWAMRWQVAADFAYAMPGGYFLGPGPDRVAYVGGDADPYTARLLTQAVANGRPVVWDDAAREQARVDFRAWGARAVVVGPDPGYPVLRRSITDLFGQEPERRGGVDIWRDPAALLG
jgi:hypothetical protein